MTLQTETQALYVNQPYVTFQWRGSCDGITWSHWRYFDENEIGVASTVCRVEGYGYIQARKLENGFEVERCPIQTWE